ncbi:hypothetical protein [Streptomyces sp. NPDC060188]|uniref:hypothetical protein n=1 Tax=Streptomyces sp. NPDC060188 TaxID=3347068 RepID=UPI003668E2DE
MLGREGGVFGMFGVFEVFEVFEVFGDRIPGACVTVGAPGTSGSWEGCPALVASVMFVVSVMSMPLMASAAGTVWVGSVMRPVTVTLVPSIGLDLIIITR